MNTTRSETPGQSSTPTWNSARAFPTPTYRRDRTTLLAGAVVAMILHLSITASLAALILSENMGTTAPGSSPYPSVSTFTGFQNYGTLSYSGSGDVRATSDSSSYTGASGSDNVYLTSGGAVNFIIGSINTVGYTSLTLSFGAWKSAIASSMSELTLQYSINGGLNYSALSIPAQPTGTGTAVWRLISSIGLPSDAEGVSDLRFQWVNTAGSGVTFRLDEIALNGTLVPEPVNVALAVFGGIGAGVWGVRRFVNRRKPAQPAD